MKTVRIIILASCGVTAGLIVLTGLLFPSVKSWLYLLAPVCGLHLLLALIVTACKMEDAGKIAAWCWQGISVVLCIGLLIIHFLRDERGWLLAAAALLGFTVLVTLVFGLLLKPTTQLQNAKS